MANLGFVCWCAHGIGKIQSGKEENGELARRILLLFIIFSLTMVAGVRDHVGTDFSTYQGIFEYNMKQAVLPFIRQKEGFFWGISAVVGKFTENVTAVFVVHAAIIIVLFVGTLYKYSIYFELTLFLYIAMMDYYSSFNGMRQWTAAAILFAGVKYLYERKMMKYFMLVLAACLFHNTAILMIPLYFFVTQKTWSHQVKIFSVLIIGVAFTFPDVSKNLFLLLEGSDYQKYMVWSIADDGVNILRVLVAFVPVAVSTGYYKHLYKTEAEKKWLDILLNFSLLNFLVLVVALRSTVLARIGMYFSTYNALLIPYFIRLFTREGKKRAVLIIVVLFMLYMVLLLPKESHLLPYRTIWSSSV